MSELRIEKLEWDSAFFDLNVLKIDLSNSTFSTIELAIEIAILINTTQLIYFFCKPNQVEHHLYLQSIGAKLYDQKVIFAQVLDGNYNSNNSIKSLSKKEITPQMVSLAVQSGEFSRFKLDTKIPHEKFVELYRIWITKSINKEIATETFGYYEDEKLLGIITLGIKNKRADIGLLAVDSKSRGKSIGNKLIEHTMNFAKMKNFKTIQVATQLENELACNFYKKNKFIQESVTNIYHLWN